MKKALFSLFLIVSLFYSYKLLGLWSLIFFVVGVSLLASLKIGRRAYLISNSGSKTNGFAPIFPDTCYHLTHYWPAAADIPVASDNPVHYADAIRYNARTPLQGSLLPLTRLV